MNIFSKVSKAFTDVLSVDRASASPIINISSTPDYEKVPSGFFRVITASGKETLGFKCPSFLSWSVGPTVVVGRQRVTLDKPKKELPLVRLNFGRSAHGTLQVGGRRLIETDSMEGNAGSVSWGGDKPRGGVEYL